MSTQKPSVLVAFGVVALLLVAASPATAQTRDGLPRPAGYPITPTVSYGPLPTTSPAAACEWYGFSHILYPSMSSTCQSRTRAVLSTANAALSPFSYYYILSMVFDTATNDSYCIQGCFDIAAAAPPPGFELAPPPFTPPTPAPVPRSPPPPAPTVTPSPPLLSPPPLLSSPPPPIANRPPPPATLFTPPPVPSTETPPATNPPPPGTRVINLGGAALGYKPTGYLSIFLSAIALILGAL